jgi:hypothetical protein
VKKSNFVTIKLCYLGTSFFKATPFHPSPMLSQCVENCDSTEDCPNSANCIDRGCRFYRCYKDSDCTGEANCNRRGKCEDDEDDDDLDSDEDYPLPQPPRPERPRPPYPGRPGLPGRPGTQES